MDLELDGPSAKDPVVPALMDMQLQTSQMMKEKEVMVV